MAWHAWQLLPAPLGKARLPSRAPKPISGELIEGMHGAATATNGAVGCYLDMGTVPMPPEPTMVRLTWVLGSVIVVAVSLAGLNPIALVGES